MTHKNLNPKGTQVVWLFDTPFGQSGNLKHDISFPEQQHVNKWPSCHFIKWFGQHIIWVLVSGYKLKTNNSRSNSFEDTMIRQCLSLFGKVEMRNGGASDNWSIITKHSRQPIYINFQSMQGVTEIHNLLCNTTGSYHRWPFQLGLGASKVIDRSLVQQMEDSGSKPPCSQIMHQICINTCGGMDKFHFGRRQIIWDLLFGASINE